MTLHHFHSDTPFSLESGDVLQGIDIAFHTWGKLNTQKSNVIWVCHALTGSADMEAWWPGLMGSGKALDPDTHFIICANTLGSPYGSTSPQSLNPTTRQPWLLTFPRLSIRDMVRAHMLLADALGITRIALLTGGSMGGQQALEWAVMQPERIGQLALLATNAVSSPWSIAFNESQRLAMQADKTFDGENPAGGADGLKAARSIALLSYRCFHAYQQGQTEPDRHNRGTFKAATYQQHQGDKFVHRFDAYCYWSLLHALDSHNIGRHRDHPARVLQRLSMPVLVIGIDTDLLFPPNEQQFIARQIKGAQFIEIASPYGHDGFLIEVAKIEKQLAAFIR